MHAVCRAVISFSSRVVWNNEVGFISVLVKENNIARSLWPEYLIWQVIKFTEPFTSNHWVVPSFIDSLSFFVYDKRIIIECKLVVCVSWLAHLSFHNFPVKPIFWSWSWYHTDWTSSCRKCRQEDWLEYVISDKVTLIHNNFIECPSTYTVSFFGKWTENNTTSGHRIGNPTLLFWLYKRTFRKIFYKACEIFVDVASSFSKKCTHECIISKSFEWWN